MRVLLLSSYGANFLEDCICSGLVEVLGAENVVVFPPKAVYHSPIGEERDVSIDLISKRALSDEFDVLVLASWREPIPEHAHFLLERLQSRPLVVFLDGEDYADSHSRSAIEAQVGEISVYAKREFTPAVLGDIRTVPLPFACPDAPLPRTPADEKCDEVCWLAWEGCHHIRGRITKILQGMGLTGTIGGTRLPRDEYFAALSRAKIGVSARGHGFDTMRYWEVPFFGALLLSEEPSILIPHNFRAGENAAFFRGDLSDLGELVGHYLANEEERQRVAQAGQEHLLRYHTISARARQLLGLIAAASKGLPDLALARARWISSCGWHETRDDVAARNPGGPGDGWINEAEFLSQPIRNLAVGIELGPDSRKVCATAIGVGPAGQAVDVPGWAEALPFPDGSLDYVVANHMIEHSVEPLLVLREWRRVLRCGGVVGIVTPDCRYVDTFALNPEHKHVTDPGVLRTWVMQAGGYRVEQESLPNQGWSCGIIARSV